MSVPDTPPPVDAAFRPASFEYRIPGAGGAVRWRLAVGSATGTAPAKINEDCHGVSEAEGLLDEPHGLLVALADGIGGDGSGREAAELAVRTLLSDYPATPRSWPVAKALDRLLCAANDWLIAQSRRRREGESLVATLSALVFREDRYHLAHIGDTRAYRFRDGRLERLTTDHVWPRQDLRHVPRRAVGLDTHLVVDYADGELRAGDLFLLVSDGVWEVLGEAALHDVVGRAADPQLIAGNLVRESLARQARYMGRNDATALAVRIDAG